MSLGALVLAAGQSRRFGPRDKLMEPLDGAPLVAAAFRLTRRAGIAHRIAVVSSAPVAQVASSCDLAPLMIAPGQPQSASLRAGVERLRQLGVSRLLLLLGDMPFVMADDLDRLLALDAPACCATQAGVALPPALFPADWFDALMRMQGDRGAGHLLQDLDPSRRIVLAGQRSRDVDLPGDLP